MSKPSKLQIAIANLTAIANSIMNDTFVKVTNVGKMHVLAKTTIELDYIATKYDLTVHHGLSTQHYVQGTFEVTINTNGNPNV